MSTISDFVIQGGQSITAGQVDAFRSHLAAYKLKAETLEATGHHDIRDQALFLLRFIEDVLDGAYESADFPALPEAIFALRYLAKGVDIIPDNTSEGYSDDEAVILEVLREHAEEFRRYAAKNHLHFEKLLPKG